MSDALLDETGDDLLDEINAQLLQELTTTAAPTVGPFHMLPPRIAQIVLGMPDTHAMQVVAGEQWSIDPAGRIFVWSEED